jgi:hypothetical protein
MLLSSCFIEERFRSVPTRAARRGHKGESALMPVKKLRRKQSVIKADPAGYQ